MASALASRTWWLDQLQPAGHWRTAYDQAARGAPFRGTLAIVSVASRLCSVLLAVAFSVVLILSLRRPFHGHARSLAGEITEKIVLRPAPNGPYVARHAGLSLRVEITSHAVGATYSEYIPSSIPERATSLVDEMLGSQGLLSTFGSDTGSMFVVEGENDGAGPQDVLWTERTALLAESTSQLFKTSCVDAEPPDVDDEGIAGSTTTSESNRATIQDRFAVDLLSSLGSTATQASEITGTKHVDTCDFDGGIGSLDRFGHVTFEVVAPDRVWTASVTIQLHVFAVQEADVLTLQEARNYVFCPGILVGGDVPCAYVFDETNVVDSDEGEEPDQHEALTGIVARLAELAGPEPALLVLAATTLSPSVSMDSATPRQNVAQLFGLPCGRVEISTKTSWDAGASAFDFELNQFEHQDTLMQVDEDPQRVRHRFRTRVDRQLPRRSTLPERGAPYAATGDLGRQLLSMRAQHSLGTPATIVTTALRPETSSPSSSIAVDNDSA